MKFAKLPNAQLAVIDETICQRTKKNRTIITLGHTLANQQPNSPKSAARLPLSVAHSKYVNICESDRDSTTTWRRHQNELYRV